MILELRDYSSKMNRDDLYEFEMLLKRDKDDEDLDSVSHLKLQTLYSRYVRKKTKQDVEELLRKYRNQSKNS